MNEAGVLTRREEKEQFVGQNYNTPSIDGTYIMRLDCRNWYNRRGVYALVCNFTKENGEKIALFAFRHKRTAGEIYCPKKTDIDFAHDVADGTWWKCTVQETKGGKLTWLTAEAL